jgi:hypothetical protein
MVVSKLVLSSRSYLLRRGIDNDLAAFIVCVYVCFEIFKCRKDDLRHCDEPSTLDTLLNHALVTYPPSTLLLEFVLRL